MKMGGEQINAVHQAGVAAYLTTGSRMRRVALREERLLVDDCYNANPQAMASALRILAGTAGHRLAILGDMGELGELSPAAHRAAGELAAQLQLDAVVAIGPKSYDIAVGGGKLVQHFFTMEEAMPTIHQLFTPGTTALVKASHAMAFEKIVKELEETYQ
jgi:UDP-N-acetylmuramoyl-tripeptide--D-alanyl-D-alanine ligase